MAACLVDTSVWVDYFNGYKGKEAEWLTDKISKDKEIAICPPILQEVLQGIRNDSMFDIVKELLLSLKIFQLDGSSAAIEAANMFRTLRKKGITIRTGIDCLIALHAIHYDIPLLQKDKDFILIARHSKLKIQSV